MAHNRVTDIAVHEGVPGHDWHYRFMTENVQAIANIRWLTLGAVQDTSPMWGDSMATEGWTHYAEALMSTPAPGQLYGFYTQDTYLYFLQFALFRAVRVRVDIGLHTEQMSYDKAVDYFTAHFSFYPDACAHAQTDPEANAICDMAQKEIYRYSKWPTQTITYHLGKRAVIELRDACQAKLGASYSDPAFYSQLLVQETITPGFYHDEFLRDHCQ